MMTIEKEINIIIKENVKYKEEKGYKIYEDGRKELAYTITTPLEVEPTPAPTPQPTENEVIIAKLDYLTMLAE